jgi:cytochrome c553
VAGVLTVVMLAGVYGFVNTEQTALTTVPPQPSQVAVYVPQTPTPVPTKPPTPTPLPATATPEGQTAESAEQAVGFTWDDIAPLILAKCAACHSTADMTGLAMDTYAHLIAGGKNGPVVVPGDSANSILYTLQAAGGHPGTFTAEELAIVQSWIDAGAIESVEPTSGPVWDGDIATLLQTKCNTCHGPAATGGLIVSSYVDIMNGSTSGLVVNPGDGANSLLITIQQAGGHPGQLTPEEIARVQAWIDAGALEK